MEFSKKDFDKKKNDYYKKILEEAKGVANTKSESKLKKIRDKSKTTAGIKVFKELLDGIKDKNYSSEEIANIYRNCMNFADNDDERVYIVNRYLYSLIAVKELMANFYMDIKTYSVKETDPQFTQLLTSETLGFVIENISRIGEAPVKAFISAPSTTNFNFTREGKPKNVNNENRKEGVYNFRQSLKDYQKRCQQVISEPMADALQDLNTSIINGLRNNYPNMSNLVYQTPDRTNCNQKHFENRFSFFKYCVLYPAVNECTCGILHERKNSTPSEQS